MLLSKLVGLLWTLVSAGAPPIVQYDVVKTYAHASNCFTEGLFLSNGTEVLESCGLTGKSFLRKYVLQSGQTLKQVALDSKYFGEGMAQLGSSLFVLTYQHHEMLEYNAADFTFIQKHPFPYGQGWGLTTDGCDLLASTGSSYVYRLRRDSKSGEISLVSKVEVTVDGKPLERVNELEYVTPKLWVNEFVTNRVWRVDPSTGACELQIDVGQLHRWTGEATPNGIAYSTALGSDLLLVTGKLWPKMFALRLKPDELCGAEVKPECPAAPPSACHQVAATAQPEATLATTALPTAAALPEVGLPPSPAKELPPSPAKELPPNPAAPPMSSHQAEPPYLPPLPWGFTAVSSSLSFVLLVSAIGTSLFVARSRRRNQELLRGTKT